MLNGTYAGRSEPTWARLRAPPELSDPISSWIPPELHDSSETHTGLSVASAVQVGRDLDEQ